MNYLSKVKPNKVGRDFVVGDIHGCYDLLFQLLDQINFNYDKDRLFSVGDLVDRGPDSLVCLGLLFEDWFYAVRGNHEQMMIEVVLHKNSHIDGIWESNGGRWWQFITDNEIDYATALVRLADKLPAVIEVDNEFRVCHAECPVLDAHVTEDWVRDNIDDILWSRDIVQGWKHPVGSTPTYVGHTPRTDVETRGNHIYIDTGAFHTNRLTIVEPKTGKTWTT